MAKPPLQPTAPKAAPTPKRRRPRPPAKRAPRQACPTLRRRTGLNTAIKNRKSAGVFVAVGPNKKYIAANYKVDAESWPLSSGSPSSRPWRPALSPGPKGKGPPGPWVQTVGEIPPEKEPIPRQQRAKRPPRKPRAQPERRGRKAKGRPKSLPTKKPAPAATKKGPG
ncbi:sperm-specific protein PHI-2B/PHI-3-like [Homalodisca vitripennis]|uniref:sperm-specific protein PHI-2B/PHI-3-like n=1 Tax=Homalodisca vitripennis TaxID=197043 RepID=UPI001EEBA781|nr:sperm-specific protein PHI-2B/PHI-3-like [Homalodisca vitripennis]